MLSTTMSENTAPIDEDDVLCLKSIKHSLEDPHNFLKSWDFDNPNINLPGFICKFNGIICWNSMENRVLGMNLSYFGLKGKFPSEISKCSGLQSLNLSHNRFYGSIPSNISTMLPFLVTLKMSSNRFSGEIPASLGNCSYLNALELDHNRFSGRIPDAIGELQRVSKFSVANNLLVGPIPHFVNGRMFNATSYANNLGLCGYPLKPCKP
uniref:Leucine-rich repeat-containing N-terminal plant-type domain-containing protein n=2 Tax=Chenopodium quinoa TaxID=63459 RepID=A0A803L874_CHEQI